MSLTIEDFTQTQDIALDPIQSVVEDTTDHIIKSMYEALSEARIRRLSDCTLILQCKEVAERHITAQIKETLLGSDRKTRMVFQRLFNVIMQRISFRKRLPLAFCSMNELTGDVDAANKFLSSFILPAVVPTILRLQQEQPGLERTGIWK